MQRDTCDIFLGLYSVTERRQRGDHGITVCARTTAPRRSVRRAAYEHSPCGRATPGGNYLLRPTADGERPALHYVNDEVRAIARREAAGKPTLTAKARVLYDWGWDHMQYDKSVPGFGLGDIPYCLKVGKGNCTDFHTLFIALARASGIPARWNMGFPLAYGDGTPGGPRRR